jgi:hypothetical protein
LPAQVSFPTTGVGTASSPVVVTITNSSAGLALSSLRLLSTAGFNLTSNSCGSSIAPGVSCAVGVAFAPTTAGSQTGALTIASDSLATSVTVPLSGVGFDFQVSVSGSSTKTVVSGQTASYTFTINPSSGLAGAFTFACGSLPQYAACVFNPSTETVAPGSTGTAALQITTSQTGSSMAIPGLLNSWRALPVAFGFLLMPIALRRRKFKCVPWSLVLLSIVISGCSSSGGGTSGSSPPPTQTTHSTPAGTYSVPVLITSSGVQHAVTLTLVVD